MKITYLKDHNGKRAGDKDDVAEGLGKYLIAVHVAKETKEKKADEESKEKKEVTHGKEKKNIEKP